MAYSYIGKIVSTHGLEGKVILKHVFDKGSVFNKLDHIFIEERKNSFIPYFPEEKKVIAADEVLLRLDEVYSVEQARLFSGKQVYIETDLFNRLQQNKVSTDMKGYRIIDQQKGILGMIEDLFETPGQVLATLFINEKEVIIPLIPTTIVEVNALKKEIKVNLPEGLLDIYLD